MTGYWKLVICGIVLSIVVWRRLPNALQWHWTDHKIIIRPSVGDFNPRGNFCTFYTTLLPRCFADAAVIRNYRDNHTYSQFFYINRRHIELK